VGDTDCGQNADQSRSEHRQNKKAASDPICDRPDRESAEQGNGFFKAL
jgi:hypothetical protein